MRGPIRAALAAVVLSSGCASVPATRPASAPVPVAAAPTLAEADSALADGRVDDALWLYERLALDALTLDERAEAMERAAFLRASNRLGARNLARVQEWAAMRQAMEGPTLRLVEIAALETLAAELSLRTEEIHARLAEMERLQHSLDQARADARGRTGDLRSLRATNATLRAEVAKLRSEAEKLQAELQRKEEALKKIAASIAGGVGDR